MCRAYDDSCKIKRVPDLFRHDLKEVIPKRIIL